MLSATEALFPKMMASFCHGNRAFSKLPRWAARTSPARRRWALFARTAAGESDTTLLSPSASILIATEMGRSMIFRSSALLSVVTFACCIGPVHAQQSVESKAAAIKDTLVTLCLAGGSESTFTAQGDLELRAKIKDILTGNGGADAGTKSSFSRHTWEGIIGGLSKDMTAAQSQQATEARACMIDNGFPLLSRVLSEK